MKTIEIDHVDIVVTHECPIKCKFCIDKFINTSNNVVSTESVGKFLKKISDYGVKPNTEVLFLGGEPTSIGIDKLTELSAKVREFGFIPIISTNTRNRDMWLALIEIFDWVQITVHSNKDIEFLEQYSNRVNIKIAGDKSFTLEKMNDFIAHTDSFSRKSVSMYFTADFEELCKDERVWHILNNLEWERNGSYLYTFYKGVRFKRCIHGETNIIDEPTVPKLYPNGNYNCTWCDEENNDYLTK